MVSIIDLLIVIVALVILWVVVSIPVYAAAKVVTKGKATFGEAMTATLGGAIVYVIVLVGVSLFLGVLLGPIATALAFILALLAWLAVYKSSFNTGWLGAIAIAILAAIMILIVNVILVALFGVALPSFFHPL